MSFRCGACGSAQPPKQKPVLVPVEFREKEYRGDREMRTGYEIAREINLCTECAEDISPSVKKVLNHELDDVELAIMRDALSGIGRQARQ